MIALLYVVGMMVGIAMIVSGLWALALMPAFWVLLAMILIVANFGWGSLFFLFACFIALWIYAEMN